MTPIAFFLKFLLIPLIAIVMGFFFSISAKKNALLSKKRLILMIITLSLIFALPFLLGYLSYYFVPLGLIILECIYLFLGILYVRFTYSGLFRSIGLPEGSISGTFLPLIAAMILGGWAFYIFFGKVSDQPYSIWVTFTLVWAIFPLLYSWTDRAYLNIAPAVYKTWIPQRDNSEFWDTIDLSQQMIVTVKLNRRVQDKEIVELTVKAPREVNFGKWFAQVADNHDRKFPDKPMDFISHEYPFQWIFYKSAWFHLWRSYIDADKTLEENRIKDNSVIYAKRVEIISNS